LGRAATAGSEQEEDHVEAPIQAVPTAVLQKHADKMFSGATGAVVASGEGAQTTAPTYELCKNVVELVDVPGLPSRCTFDG